jgi:hypothetical protein
MPISKRKREEREGAVVRTCMHSHLKARERGREREGGRGRGRVEHQGTCMHPHLIHAANRELEVVV